MKTKRELYWFIFIAILSSLLFGMNMAAISGAVTFIKEIFILNDVEIGLVVSSMIAGCLIGVFIVGSVSDKLEKKKMMIFAAILFVVSSLGSGAAQNMWHLIVARLIGGIAAGAISVVIPTYISKITTPAIRCNIGTMNQLGIVVGILIAYVIDYSVIDIQDGWRYMLYSPIVFAVPFVLLSVISFSESSRRLVLKGKVESARGVFQHLVDPIEAQKEPDDIKVILHSDSDRDREIKASFYDLFKGKPAKVLIIGILLAIFQQITGINAIIAYAPTIFEKTGTGDDTALLQSILLGVINLIFTLVSVWLINKIGRKKLLLWGATGMIATLSYITYAFYTNHANGMGIFVALLGYIAFFSASFAPVIWVVTSEIYPNKIRGLAMSVSTAISWVCTLLVVQFFPYILENLGGAFSFGFFLAFSVLAFVFTLVRIPETKGRTLEQIEESLGLTKQLTL